MTENQKKESSRKIKGLFIYLQVLIHRAEQLALTDQKKQIK